MTEESLLIDEDDDFVPESLRSFIANADKAMNAATLTFLDTPADVQQMPTDHSLDEDPSISNELLQEDEEDRKLKDEMIRRLSVEKCGSAIPSQQQLPPTPESQPAPPSREVSRATEESPAKQSFLAIGEKLFVEGKNASLMSQSMIAEKPESLHVSHDLSQSTPSLPKTFASPPRTKPPTLDSKPALDNSKDNDIPLTDRLAEMQQKLGTPGKSLVRAVSKENIAALLGSKPASSAFDDDDDDVPLDEQFAEMEQQYFAGGKLKSEDLTPAMKSAKEKHAPVAEPSASPAVERSKIVEVAKALEETRSKEAKQGSLFGIFYGGVSKVKSLLPEIAGAPDMPSPKASPKASPPRTPNLRQVVPSAEKTPSIANLSKKPSQKSPKTPVISPLSVSSRPTPPVTRGPQRGAKSKTGTPTDKSPAIDKSRPQPSPKHSMPLQVVVESPKAPILSPLSVPPSPQVEKMGSSKKKTAAKSPQNVNVPKRDLPKAKEAPPQVVTKPTPPIHDSARSSTPKVSKPIPSAKPIPMIPTSLAQSSAVKAMVRNPVELSKPDVSKIGTYAVHESTNSPFRILSKSASAKDEPKNKMNLVASAPIKKSPVNPTEVATNKEDKVGETCKEKTSDPPNLGESQNDAAFLPPVVQTKARESASLAPADDLVAFLPNVQPIRVEKAVKQKPKRANISTKPLASRLVKTIPKETKKKPREPFSTVAQSQSQVKAPGGSPSLQQENMGNKQATDAMAKARARVNQKMKEQSLMSSVEKPIVTKAPRRPVTVSLQEAQEKTRERLRRHQLRTEEKAKREEARRLAHAETAKSYGAGLMLPRMAKSETSMTKVKSIRPPTALSKPLIPAAQPTRQPKLKAPKPFTTSTPVRDDRSAVSLAEGMDHFMHELRQSTPIPAHTTLTTPKPFRFHYNKPTEEQKKRGSSPTLAEKLNFFDRHLRETEPLPAVKREDLKPTVPISPNFTPIAKREKPKSTEERDLEILDTFQFRARPVLALSASKPPLGASAKIPVRKLTVPKPFNLTPDLRSGSGGRDSHGHTGESESKGSDGFHALPMPNFGNSPLRKPPRVSVMKSMKPPVAIRPPEEEKKFHAKPLPKFIATSKSTTLSEPLYSPLRSNAFKVQDTNIPITIELRGVCLDRAGARSSPRPVVTTPEPFNLSSCKKSPVVSPDEIEMKKQFKARSLPASTFVEPPVLAHSPYKAITSGKSAAASPFRLSSNSRRADARKQLQERLAKEEEQRHKQRRVKARPMPNYKEVFVSPTKKHPIRPATINGVPQLVGELDDCEVSAMSELDLRQTESSDMSSCAC